MLRKIQQFYDTFLDFIESPDSEDCDNEDKNKAITNQTLFYINTMNELSSLGKTLYEKSSKEFELQTLHIFQQVKELNINSTEHKVFPNLINHIDNETADTLLTFAIRCGKANIVRTLLENSADPNCVNKENDSPIILAVKILKEADEFSLHASKIKSYHHIISLLMEAKANILSPNGDILRGQRTVFDYLKSDDKMLCEIFIRALSDPNEKKLDRFPLNYAIKYNNKKLVQLLLDKNADPNAKKYLTPLGEAVYRHHYGIFTLLLNYPEKRSDQSLSEAYNFALAFRDLKVIKDLLIYGFKIPNIPELKHCLDKCSQGNPHVLSCLDKICDEKLKAEQLTEFMPILHYHKNLRTLNSIFFKKVSHSINEGLADYVPKVLLDLVQSYDVPMEGRVALKLDEINEQFQKKCVIQ
jgi:ankyrin repeat protein